MLKQYKYYAIRLHDTIIVRKSLVGLRRITSVLSKPGTSFLLKQITYTGGIVLGSMPYKTWASHGGPPVLSYIKMDRTIISGLRPYLIGGEKHGPITRSE